MTESQVHMSSFAYANLGVRWNIWSRFYTSLKGNLLIGKSPVLYYATNVDNTKDISRLGVGLSIGIDLPMGPLNLDIGHLISDNKTKLYFGLGYRHIY